MSQMIQNNLQFRGTMTEDPNQHLKWFLQHCDTFKYNRVIDDAIHLRHQDLPRRDELAGKFLQEFFPINKVVKLRRKSVVFRQMVGKSLYKAWEQFKILIQKCSHHKFPEWMQLQEFYNRLDTNAWNGLGRVVAGALMNRTYEDE
ncbi:oligopeptide transporter 4-like [Gossypium australe]|uniref:Oligopeptide transporter 4-like n=1 Tax=Gossypium australe TaxID=47621 RepID=A0A5B6WSX2_9ROSI|nr:oligopeptide transporter 4-like [Gossypium australe]